MKKLAGTACKLCESAGGDTLWQDELCRVVLVAGSDYPGLCRVIVNRHVREMTDLDMTTRQKLMRVVYAVEQSLRELLRPDKVNLASLGNQVPHLHWHVVARFADDRHFPGSVWSEPLREGVPHPLEREALVLRLRNLLQAVAE